jgi:hypothetical protein
MTQIADDFGAGRGQADAKYPAVHYMNADAGIKSWLFTLDHKRISLMYLVLTTVFLPGRRPVRRWPCGSSTSRPIAPSWARTPTTGCSPSTAWS